MTSWFVEHCRITTSAMLSAAKFWDTALFSKTMFTLVYPLVLACISGLAYLAVKHPAVYEKLFNKLYFCSGVAGLVLGLWSTAVSKTLSALYPFIADGKQAAAAAAADGISVSLGWVVIWQLLSMAYLLFLSWLANQIKNDRSAKNEDA
jgi:hypothetical protein